MEDSNVIMNGRTTHDYLLYCLGLGLDYLKNIEHFKELLDGILDSSQYDIIKSLLFENICDKVTYFNNITVCETFARGLTQKGIVILISNYLHVMRITLKEYEELDDDDTEPLDSYRLYQCCIFT